MSSVWRKIQRSNKKATKFEFTAQLQELSLQCSSDDWNPNKLCVAWVHRRRRYVTKEYRWESTITDPKKGLIVWGASAEMLKMLTTLYRDPRNEGYEDKEWTFVIEEISVKGKRRPIAAVNLNLRLFIHEIPGAQTQVKLKLRPLTAQVRNCLMQLTLTSTVLKEGNALDDDMASVASDMSKMGEKRSVSPMDINKLNNPDIANLNDFEESTPSGSATHSQDIASVVADIERLKESTLDPPNATSTPANPYLNKPLFEFSAKRKPEIVPEESLVKQNVHNISPIKPYSNNVFKPNEDSGMSIDLTDTTPSNISVNTTVKETEMNSGSCVLSPQITEKSINSEAKINSSQDLLQWCREICAPYKIKVDDFARSFRNGIVFCTLIHAHKPEIMPTIYSLKPENIRDNVTLALDASGKLGVPRLIDPNDMVILAVPDKIAVISYVHSLRAVLTGTDSSLSNSAIVSPKASNTNHSIFSLSELDAKVLEEFDRLKQERDDDNAMDFSEPHDEIDSKIETPTKKHRKKRKSKSDKRKSLEEELKVSTPSPKLQSPSPKMTSPSSKLQSPSPKMTSPSPLMTRKQLNDPFGSDDENEAIENVEKTVEIVNEMKEEKSAEVCRSSTSRSRSASNSMSIEIPEKNVNGMSKEDDLKRRAKLVLDQFTKDVEIKGRELTPELEDERRRALREKARKLIQETKDEVVGTVSITCDDSNQPSTSQSANNDNKFHSLPRNLASSMDRSQSNEKLNMTPLKRSGSITRRTEFYRPKLKGSTTDLSATPKPIESPSIPAMRGLKMQSYPNTPTHTPKNTGLQVWNSCETTLDRFKRYGSMRRQELTQSINVLSGRFADTVRSTSVPKELSDLHSALPKTNLPLSHSVAEPRQAAQGHKLSDWEKDVHRQRTLVTQLEDLNLKQKALDQQATSTEKQWRVIMDKAPGSEEEQRLMNEFLRLLNERNLLYRHELHLSLMQKIEEQETKFKLVQDKLAQLIQIEDDEKTEKVKRDIDCHMEQLVDIVNARDGLVQQLMQNEQGTEDDTELGIDAIQQGRIDPTQLQDKNCAIM